MRSRNNCGTGWHTAISRRCCWNLNIWLVLWIQELFWIFTTKQQSEISKPDSETISLEFLHQCHLFYLLCERLCLRGFSHFQCSQPPNPHPSLLPSRKPPLVWSSAALTYRGVQQNIPVLPWWISMLIWIIFYDNDCHSLIIIYCLYYRIYHKPNNHRYQSYYYSAASLCNRLDRECLAPPFHYHWSIVGYI